MLTGHKKSRYNIYDNLEFLSLNSYELKHFCFGEGGGGDDGGGGDSADDADSMDSGTGPGNDGLGGGPAGGFGDASPGYGGPGVEGSTGIDVDATFDGLSDFDPGFGMGVDLGSAFGGFSGYFGVDEGQPSNMASFVDQATREGFSIAGVPGINAAEARDAINAAMQEGRIGYNTAVDLGFPSLIDQAEKDFDLATAIGIENKYGLERGQVNPGFGSFSYQGPNAISAAMSEIGSAARGLATSYYDMFSEMPSLTGTVAGMMGLAVPGSVIGLGAREAFGLSRESEIGKNISDALEAVGLSSIPTSIDEAALGLAQAAAEEATGLDLSAEAIAEGLFDSVFGTEEEEENAFTGFETTDVGLSSNLGSPSASVADIGSQAESPEESIDPGGDEFIPRPTPIPSPPQIASLPAQNIFREPVTRTAAADTFSILSRIYGPEVARQLAPNRTV